MDWGTTDIWSKSFIQNQTALFILKGTDNWMQQKYYLHIQNIDIHEIIIIQYSQLNQILPISIVLQI